ncbi:MAG: XisI protein [Saprospiraceae bacterium]|jgi:hypothetical protein|nr:XisI protein [Saprospiraceae bacterium]
MAITKKIKKYQAILLEILEQEKADYTGTKYQELEDQIIADLERNHFQLVRVGWADDTRLLDIKLQFDIKPDGKIWLQENQTDVAIDDELLKRGVPATDIVLGMQPPAYRQFTEFAVG